MAPVSSILKEERPEDETDRTADADDEDPDGTENTEKSLDEIIDAYAS